MSAEMAHNRDHILPVVLFSSTITILVVLSLAKYFGLCERQEFDVDREWQSPSKVIVSELLEAVRNKGYTISPYDQMFQEICDKHGTDWKLMSAIAYAESRFKTHAISHYGARGLMQVTPRSAAAYGISEDMLHDPESNIWAANLIFKHIEEMLSLPESTSNRDKICLILASYNCGIGRLFDAQRLAESEGRDPCKWSNISHYLRKLSDPEYYNRDVVYHGRFSGGSKTRAYVNIVTYTYDRYRRLNQDESWQFVWR